jgi:hypothetical protein
MKRFNDEFAAAVRDMLIDHAEQIDSLKSRLREGLVKMDKVLDEITKVPKIKGFYYCDPLEGMPADDDLFPCRVEVVKDSPGLSDHAPINPRDIEFREYEAPPCFNCDSDCSHCGEDDCVLQRVDGICGKCSSADKCFS